MNWPSPVRSRWSSAAVIPESAWTPVVISPRPTWGNEGGSVALANHAQNARIRASDEIVAGTIRQRAMLSEGGNRAHDEPGVERLHRFIAEAETTDYAGRIVLDQDIDLWNQFLDNPSRSRISEIEAQTFFATILLDVVGAAPVAKVRHSARDITIGREFDLDYVGAHFAHVASRRRSGQDLSEIEYAIALEHALR